jgi:1-acyl-sn-glycerol-3-phosphate acyltransferase
MPLLPSLDAPEIAERVDLLGIPFNRHGLDLYGMDKAALTRVFTLLRPLYNRYFSMRTYGLEHVPDTGRGMGVGNHSGGVALDAALMWGATFFDKDPPRLAQGMAEKFLAAAPFTAKWTAKTGQLTGLPEHARRLLNDDRLLMVFPEGARGTAKLYPERHSLVRFGTGFIRLALQTGSPIVPVAFIGGGEAIPTIHNSRALGRLFGAPYVPFTPWLVALPRPTACQAYYGPAMRFEGDGNEEDETIQEYVEQVKARIAAMIELGVDRRNRGALDEPFEFPGAEGGAS